MATNEEIVMALEAEAERAEAVADETMAAIHKLAAQAAEAAEYLTPWMPDVKFKTFHRVTSNLADMAACYVDERARAEGLREILKGGAR